MTERRIAEPVMSQLEVARAALAQAEAYVPRDNWSRARRADNVRQLKEFIEQSAKP